MEFNKKDLFKRIEFNRRNFIKLMVGGAVGINITPLPWKVTDDIAIWTQNWPWVPVPPTGEFSHERSVCRLCPGSCGIEVRKVDERPVKIEGRTDYPVNPGGICPLGAGGLQLLYNENNRFTSPMKRIGPRGLGQFVPISWEEAIKELSDRVTRLRQEGRPEALAVVDGHPSDSTMALLIERLLKAVGSPNYVRIPSSEDTYAMANRMMMGTGGTAAYDLENADYVLSFGAGLIEGWGSPGRMIHAWGIWHNTPLKGKTKIVQIESRASNTASKADQWVTPLPGTEAALALGMCHVIIRQGLYDAEFIRNQTFGFEDWVSANTKDHQGFKSLVLEKYPPTKVAQITGLDQQEIVSLATAFAQAKAPIAVCGKGKGTLNGNLLEYMAVQTLNALKGSINKPGGVLVLDPLPLSPWSEPELDAVAQAGHQKGRLDQAGTPRYPFSQSLINLFTEAIIESPESPVDTLLVFSGNPAYTLPDGSRFNHALKKIPYIVSFSPYQDETAYMADLILPDHTYLEKIDDAVCPPGLQYPLYTVSRPVVAPLYDTRHSGDVIIQVAKAQGGSVESAFPWKNFEACLKARAQGLFDSEGGGWTGYDESRPTWMETLGTGSVKKDNASFDKMWRKIKSSGFWYRPKPRFEGQQNPFQTPTGKFEFFSSKMELAVKALAEETGGSVESALKEMGIAVKGDEAFMPHYEPPATSVDPKTYPLRMMPYELINLSSGWVPNPPYLKKTLFDNQLSKDESFAEINPKTAIEYGLKQGDRATVESPVGKVQVRINTFDGAMPGIVYMPLGFGHTAYDDFMKGKGVNPNKIIDGGKDPVSGQAVWWETRVRIRKA